MFLELRSVRCILDNFLWSDALLSNKKQRCVLLSSKTQSGKVLENMVTTRRTSLLYYELMANSHFHGSIKATCKNLIAT